MKYVTGFITRLFMLVGFGVWTVYLLKDGFTWWSLPTGFLTLIGAIMISESFFEPSAQTTEQGGEDLSSG